MRLFKIIFLISFGLSLNISALGAGDKITFSVAAFKFIEGVEVPDDNNSSLDSVETTQDYQFIDVGVCYNMSFFCLGLKYIDSTITHETTYHWSNGATSQITTDREFGGLGLKIGFTGDNLIAHGSYLIDPTLNETTQIGFASNTHTYNVTQAVIFDVGYGFKMKSLRIGPMLSLITFDVDKYNQENGTEVEAEFTYSWTAPYFALWMDF